MVKQKDPEDFLRRFSRRTPPPDLRERVLQAVGRKRRPEGSGGLGRRKIVFASLTVIFVSTAIDAVLSRLASDRLSGMIGNSSFERSALPDRGTFAAFPDAADEFLPGELASIVQRGTAPQKGHARRPLRTGKDTFDEI
jgi:hypothetical protein